MSNAPVRALGSPQNSDAGPPAPRGGWQEILYARVMELPDIDDLESSERKLVRVEILPWVPILKSQ